MECVTRGVGREIQLVAGKSSLQLRSSTVGVAILRTGPDGSWPAWELEASLSVARLFELGARFHWLTLKNFPKCAHNTALQLHVAVQAKL